MAEAPSGTVWLVYARQGPEGAEPVVAVVTTESEASDIEHAVAARGHGVLVRWETHQVTGPVSRDVHVVFLAAGGVGDGEAADPVALAVFGARADAEQDFDLRRARDGGEDLFVRSMPLGWRRDGWPFFGGPQPG